MALPEVILNLVVLLIVLGILGALLVRAVPADSGAGNDCLLLPLAPCPQRLGA
jgi:hypothetical protein